MKRLIGAAALAAACFITAAPAAATETYVSGGYSSESMDFAAVGGGKARIGLITTRLGWKSDSWFGVEGELSFGISDDDIATAPTVTVKVDTIAAIYGVAYLPVGDKVQLLGRLGYGHQISKVESGATSIETKDGALSYGVGATYSFDAKNAVRGDFTITDIDDVDTNTLSVSFVRKF